MSDDPNRLRGRKALVLGLGSRQGGVGVARYLVESGAAVRVTDLRSGDDLAGPLADLAGLPVEYTLGRHDEDDIAWADVIVRNPAVRRESTLLDLARRLGKRVEMEMTLFFRACPAPIAGVTGTKGKTTTTTLLHEMSRQRWPGAVLAGNMGRSALSQLDALDPDVPVALEVSSFQIEGLDEQRLSPHIAVITNVAEDHLDRYATYEDYERVKAAFAAHQTASGWLVLPGDDGRLAQLTAESAAQRVRFSERDPGGDHSLWCEAGRFRGRMRGEEIDLGPLSALRLAGEHSRMNALAAAGAALAAGVTPDEVTQAIAGFRGVRDRLEPVAVIGGVEYVNDTAATAPSAAIAALDAYHGRELIVIAGGSDKRLALDELAARLAMASRRVVLLDGSATPRLRAALVERGFAAIDGPFGSMAEAVERASREAREGTVVLLSPGCASFGMFRDEFHRGEEFRRSVAALATSREGTGRRA